MNVLLSIKPKFALEIFSGTKKFEYRRIIFKEPVDRIVVYASSPIKMVIGEFSVKDILFEDIDLLWCRTKHYSGISESYFYSYFYEKDKGYAIKVGRTIKYQTPSPLQDLYGIKPPQSFAYIDR
jgi:predicted transcriptional regulator